VATIVELRSPVPSRYGVPVIARVDVSVFEKRYFTHCLSCTFCLDRCCSYGVDVDLLHKAEIERRGEAIEAYTGVPRDRWFADEVIEDVEMPGGGAVRTRVEDGACVFLDRQDRGCLLHRFCSDMGIDYRSVKSLVDCMFPLTVVDATLAPADEVDDRTLVCVGLGPTLYDGLREELRYYFGDALLDQLDEMNVPGGPLWS